MKELNDDGTMPMKKTSNKRSGKTTQISKGSEDDGSTIPSGATLLHLMSKNVVAHGYVNEKEFVVLKGSKMGPSSQKSCADWTLELRKSLVNSGKVKDFVFTENVQFSSPSTAATVIVGRSANGLVMWKNDEGKTIKELQSKY